MKLVELSDSEQAHMAVLAIISGQAELAAMGKGKLSTDGWPSHAVDKYKDGTVWLSLTGPPSQPEPYPPIKTGTRGPRG